MQETVEGDFTVEDEDLPPTQVVDQDEKFPGQEEMERQQNHVEVHESGAASDETYHQDSVEEEKSDCARLVEYLSHNKWEAIKTFNYSLAFLGLGVILAALGPTLLLLSDNVGVSEGVIGWLFTARGLGYMFGALLAGKLFDDGKVYSLGGHRWLSVGIIILAVTTFLTPIAVNIWTLLAVFFVMGLGGGVIDVGCHTFAMWVWKSKVNPWLLFMHFCYGMGSLLSPLIIALVEGTHAFGLTNLWGGVGQADSTTRGHLLWSYWLLGAAIVPIPFWLFWLSTPKRPTLEGRFTEMVSPDTEGEEQEEEMQTMEFGGTVGLFLSNTYWDDSYINPPDNTPSSPDVNKDEETGRPDKPMDEVPIDEVKIKVTLMSRLRQLFSDEVKVTLLVGGFLFVYLGLEVSVGGLIFSYAVKTGVAGEEMADFLTSGFWGAYTVGRIGAVFMISSFPFLRSMRVLWISITLSICALLFLSFAPLTIGSMWLGFVFLGLGMAPIFPTAIGLPTAESLIEAQTGKMVAAMILGASCGQWVIPPIVNGLLSVYAHSFVWILLGGFVVLLFIHGLLLFVFRRAFGYRLCA